MYKLKLIKALSYHGIVTATKDKPEVEVDVKGTAVELEKSGYFELISAVEDEDPAEAGSSVTEPEQPLIVEQFGELSEGQLDEPEPEPEPEHESEPEPMCEPEYAVGTVTLADMLNGMPKQELIQFGEEHDIDLAACSNNGQRREAIVKAIGGDA